MGSDNWGSIQGGGEDFSFLHYVQTGSGMHPASQPTGTENSCSGGNAIDAWP
jgi:hypothetical protein